MQLEIVFSLLFGRTQINNGKGEYVHGSTASDCEFTVI